jgi:hypothetical protein
MDLDPYWESGSRNKEIDQNEQIKPISSLSKSFYTYISMFYDQLPTTSMVQCIFQGKFQFLVMAKCGQDPDVH